MEATYYMIINGRQAGPFVAEELKYHGLQPDSMVWRQGLENWVPASSLPELHHLFGGSVPPPSGSSFRRSYDSGVPRPDGFGGFPRNPGLNGEPIPHTNWLPWAIVCTVLGVFSGCISLILGIIGIVQANKANSFFNMGDDNRGRSANSTAKTVTLIGIILGVVSIIGSSIWLANGGLESYMETLQSLQNLR